MTILSGHPVANERIRVGIYNKVKQKVTLSQHAMKLRKWHSKYSAHGQFFFPTIWLTFELTHVNTAGYVEK